jgi:hypothetical protein
MTPLGPSVCHPTAGDAPLGPVSRPVSRLITRARPALAEGQAALTAVNRIRKRTGYYVPCWPCSKNGLVNRGWLLQV